MTLLKDKDPVVALAPSRADLTLDVRIGLGAAIGALITSMPSAWKTRSEPPPYLASQRYHELALPVAGCLEAPGKQASHSTESDSLVKSLSVYLTTALTCGQSTWVVGSDSLKRGRAMAWGGHGFPQRTRDNFRSWFRRALFAAPGRDPRLGSARPFRQANRTRAAVVASYRSVVPRPLSPRSRTGESSRGRCGLAQPGGRRSQPSPKSPDCRSSR